MRAEGIGLAELAGAAVSLDRIAELVAEGKDAFDTSADRRLALVFLWINVGSLLKQYVRRTQQDFIGGVLAAPIRMRDKLVYGSILNLRLDIVCDSCVVDGPPLRTLVGDLSASI